MARLPHANASATRMGVLRFIDAFAMMDDRAAGRARVICRPSHVRVTRAEVRGGGRRGGSRVVPVEVWMQRCLLVVVVACGSPVATAPDAAPDAADTRFVPGDPIVLSGAGNDEDPAVLAASDG